LNTNFLSNLLKPRHLKIDPTTPKPKVRCFSFFFLNPSFFYPRQVKFGFFAKKILGVVESYRAPAIANKNVGPKIKLATSAEVPLNKDYTLSLSSFYYLFPVIRRDDGFTQVNFYFVPYTLN
jgi:hypothetical protein